MLVDVRDLPLPVTGAGEDIKDPAFSELCMRADGFVIVAPEYNHGYPGLLKHVLDTNLKEYIHKPVGICGVSAGGFGGTRVIENLLPVMRELGLVTIFWDGNFSNVRKLFRPGRPAARPRVRQAHPQVREGIDMDGEGASLRTRERRPGVPIMSEDRDGKTSPSGRLLCPRCGGPMNFHAEKIDPAADAGSEVTPSAEFHTCPACKYVLNAPRADP